MYRLGKVIALSALAGFMTFALVPAAHASKSKEELRNTDEPTGLGQDQDSRNRHQSGREQNEDRAERPDSRRGDDTDGDGDGGGDGGTDGGGDGHFNSDNGETEEHTPDGTRPRSASDTNDKQQNKSKDDGLGYDPGDRF